jgi:hypothetical protein
MWRAKKGDDKRKKRGWEVDQEEAAAVDAGGPGPGSASASASSLGPSLGPSAALVKLQADLAERERVTAANIERVAQEAAAASANDSTPQPSASTAAAVAGAVAVPRGRVFLDIDLALGGAGAVRVFTKGASLAVLFGHCSSLLVMHLAG